MSVLVVKESFVAPGHRAFPKGTLVDSSDQLVKDNPELFESPEDAAGRRHDVAPARQAPQAAAEPAPVVEDEPAPKRTIRRK